MEQIYKFKVGDIVWAKVKGWAWWPAKVSYHLKNSNDHLTENV
jgi:hypothetical protein